MSDETDNASRADAESIRRQQGAKPSYDTDGVLIRDNQTVLREMRSNAARVVRAEIDNPMTATLRDIVEGYTGALNGEVGDAKRPKNAVRTLASNPELMAKAEALVGKEAKFAFVAGGDDSFVMAFNNDAGDMQILRVTAEKVAPTNAAELVLKPINETNIGGVRFQTMEPVADYRGFVNQGVITRTEAENMMTDFDGKMAQHGNIIVDQHPGNYGMTADGRQVAHDLGAVSSIKAERAKLETTDPYNRDNKMKRIDAVVQQAAAAQQGKPTTQQQQRSGGLAVDEAQKKLQIDAQTRLQELAQNGMSLEDARAQVAKEVGAVAQSSTVINGDRAGIESKLAELGKYELELDTWGIKDLRIPASADYAITSRVSQVVTDMGLSDLDFMVHSGPITATFYDAANDVMILSDELLALDDQTVKGIISHELDHKMRRAEFLAFYEGNAALAATAPEQAAKDKNFFEQQMEFEADRTAARHYGAEAPRKAQMELMKRGGDSDLGRYLQTIITNEHNPSSAKVSAAVEDLFAGKPLRNPDLPAEMKQPMIRRVEDLNTMLVQEKLGLLEPVTPTKQQQQHTSAGTPPNEAEAIRNRQMYVQQRAQTLVGDKGMKLEEALTQAADEFRRGELVKPEPKVEVAAPAPEKPAQQLMNEKKALGQQQHGVGNASTPEEATAIRERQIAAQKEAVAKATAPTTADAVSPPPAHDGKWHPTAQAQQKTLQTKITAADVAGPAPQTYQDRLIELMRTSSEPNPLARPDERVLNESERKYLEDKPNRGKVNLPEESITLQLRMESVRKKQFQPEVLETPTTTARAVANDGPIGPVRPEPVVDAPSLAPTAMADVPDMPHAPRGGAKMGGGVAGAVLMGGVIAGIAKADQRTEDGESYGHAFERTAEGAFTSLFNPIASLEKGDYGMATAQVFDNTGIAVSARLSEYRIGEAARSVTEEQKKELEPALPKGNMNLGSRNPRLNLIAELLAYRDQGTDYVTLYESPFSALPGIVGPGAPGMISVEGQRGGYVKDLLDEHVRNFIAEGGNMQTIREALDNDYRREQVYNRLRNVVPDQHSPGYEHRAIEARDGMQELEAFRALVQSGANNTPEGKARGIELANAYLMTQDFDENRMIANATYQYTRLNFLLARPEEFVAAGMGPFFNITGKKEDLDQDMNNIMKVLSTPSGGPDGEQIFGRIVAGNDRVAQPADIYAVLLPEMKAKVDGEQLRMAQAAAVAAAAIPVPAPAAAPAPVHKPRPEPEPQEIVVTAERYKNQPYAKELSDTQNAMIEESGLKSFLDIDRDGKVQLGELRTALKNAGVTVDDSGKVSDKQLAQLIATTRDDTGRNV